MLYACTRMILYSTTESPNAIPRNSLDKVTLNSGYIDTYWAGARTLGGTFRGRFTWPTMERKCSDKFLVQDFEAHNLSFPGNYGFQMIFFFFFWVPFILSLAHHGVIWQEFHFCVVFVRGANEIPVTQVDSTKPGEVHVLEIIPRAISFGHSPPNNSYRNWPTHRTFLSHFYFTHSSGGNLARLQLVSAVDNL